MAVVGGSVGARARVWVPLTGFAVGLACLWQGLNFDVRYVFGGLRVSPGPVFDTFTHRPLTFRLFVELLDFGPSIGTPGNRSGVVAEAIVRVEALLLVSAVCVVLWLGLRRYLDGIQPVLVAGAVWCAFALAPNWTFLEPDWLGTLWATAALGVALLAPRAWVAGVLAGVFVLLCAATKLTTAPYAVVAGGLVWLVDRRRAYLGMAWSAGLVVVWLAATWLFSPREWQWLQDMAVLFPDTPLRGGLGVVQWRVFAESLVNLAAESPVVLALPAAAVVLARSARRPAWVVAGVVVAVLLVAASAVAQGEFYLYQWAAMPILAAGLAAVALARSERLPDRIAVAGAVLVGGAVSAILLTRSLDWRVAHLGFVALVTVVIALAAVVLALLPIGRPITTRGVIPLAVAGILVAFGAANLPGSAYSLTQAHSDETNLSRFRAAAQMRGGLDDVRRKIGADTPVLYLTFGDVDYLLGNPTDCRYASPVFLQRSAYLPYVRALPSYRDNVSCLDTRARYLVVDRSWIDVSRLEQSVRTRLDGLFDCAHALHVTASVDVCPRRP